jgi:LuxR family maltose regulon positive regulatory protein
VSARDLAIADYLRSELLERRPPDEIAFLTRTSILERLDGGLCDAVMDEQGSSRRLANLARSTLLVDEYGGAYRYHSLLREFLHDELAARDPGLEVELHRRAASWLEAHGAVDQAVEHAFAAGDPGWTAAMVGRVMVPYHWSGRRATIRAWFRRFDDEALAQQPWFAVLAAWEELAFGDVATTEHPPTSRSRVGSRGAA